jgi:hypothetical protein
LPSIRPHEAASPEIRIVTVREQTAGLADENYAFASMVDLTYLFPSLGDQDTKSRFGDLGIGV